MKILLEFIYLAAGLKWTEVKQTHMRPIDADELFGMESILATAAHSPESRFLIKQVLYDIQHMPTIDVAPVVHARWVSRGSDDYDAGMYYCSACKDERYFGDEVYTSEEAEKYAHFCPNCGAKMDAEEKGAV